MAGKDFEAFKQTIEQHFMGHPVVTQNAYTAWFAKGAVPLPHLRQFTTQFSVFSNQFLLAALNRAIDVHTLRAQLLQKMLAVRLRHQGNRCIGGVQGGSNEASKAIDNSCVIRTEENLVTTWSGSIGRFGKRDTTTHESLAIEYGVDRWQQVSSGR